MPACPSSSASVSVQVDVTFPYMPCAWLSLDTMDISGELHLDVVGVGRGVGAWGVCVHACGVSGGVDVCARVHVCVCVCHVHVHACVCALMCGCEYVGACVCARTCVGWG